MLLYAATIFVSAFLLFLVQPVIAKQILPWFGGSAAVWTTCLVFFQTALLAGYAYSDFAVRRLARAAQVKLHTALLLVSLAVLPIVPGAHWKPTGAENPSWLILGLLAATIGLPYFLLSTTSPLVQAWFARARPGASPYRLFALSNLASMLALVGYPFLLEPWAPTRTQALGWSAGYALFVGLCAAAGWTSLRARAAPRPIAEAPRAEPDTESLTPDEPPPTVARQVLWCTLAGDRIAAAPRGVQPHHAEHRRRAAAMDRAARDLPADVHPLLRRQGVVPARDLSRDAGGGTRRHGLDARRPEAHARARASRSACSAPDSSSPACSATASSCALKPAPKYLTRFYLMVSLGGALGSALVGIVAPLVLPAYFELAGGLVVAALLLLWQVRRGTSCSARSPPPRSWRPPAAPYGRSSSSTTTRSSPRATSTACCGCRSSAATTANHRRSLIHGTILHGTQYMEPEFRAAPDDLLHADVGHRPAARSRCIRPRSRSRSA